MRVAVVKPRTELGVELAAQAAAAPDSGMGDWVAVNLALQRQNSLLHDGHAWSKLPPDEILASTRRALAAHPEAAFFVHASYAFLAAAGEGGRVGSRLRPIVEAALEAERVVLEAPRPACVVRLGYLYGPHSRDLRAYRLAFRLGRPYWAGPRRSLQLHLHTEDAARAVLAAARRRPAGRLVYAVDDRPASFQEFMDHFARLVGNPLPAHLPRISRLVARAVVAEEHMQMVEMAVAGLPSRRLAGFRPRYPDYVAGLRQVVTSWAAGRS